MSISKIKSRYSSAAAIDHLTRILALPRAGQDWEIEVADAGRVGEFLDVYEQRVRDDDERFALMALVVASYEDLLHDEGDADGRLWERIRLHVLDRFDLHAYTIQYWSLPDNDDVDSVFAFTARAREVMTVVYGPREWWPRQPLTVKRFTDRHDPVVREATLNEIEISDERDGTFALFWSKFNDRRFGKRRGFASVADAISFAALEFHVPPESWADV